MNDALTYAKYFIKNGYNTKRNTLDGNMKLQKMLLFANLISIAELEKPLFNDEILAFRNGCVVESVRLRYQNDYNSLVADSMNFNPDFSQEEYDVLNLCVSIFGRLSARELSDINHAFDFWNEAYQVSIVGSNSWNKNLALVTTEKQMLEIQKMKDVIASFKKTENENKKIEIINGIEFIYSPSEISLTDEVLVELYKFSDTASDRSYSVYLDDGKLVIF